MKASIIAGAAVLVLSAALMVFVNTSIIAANVSCRGEGRVLQCDFFELGVPAIIGSLFIAGFVFVDCLIIYIIIRGWQSMSRLNARLGKIEKLKETAEKDYYSKKMDEKSFRDIIQDYDKEMVELEVRLKKLK